MAVGGRYPGAPPMRKPGPNGGPPGAVGMAMAAMLATALAGCSLAPGLVEQTSRDVAKGVVNSVIQQRFPGVNAAPYTDCIIDNASSDEIVRLAQGAVAGTGDSATALVLDIAARPATTQCLAQSALLTALG